MDSIHAALIGLLIVAAIERLIAAVTYRLERREWAKERRALTKALSPQVDYSPDAPPARRSRGGTADDPDLEDNGW
jgi:hypothetical protein